MKNEKYIDLTQYNKNIKKNNLIKEKGIKSNSKSNIEILKNINKKKKDENIKDLSNAKGKSTDIRLITISSIVFLIIILFLAGNVIWKSISDVFINSNAKVATPIFAVQTNPKIDITEASNTGEYKFKVVNYENNKISDVKFAYTIEIISNSNEFINFTLYRDGKEMNLENNKTKLINMEKEKLTEHNYILKISYDKNKISSIYEIIDNIQIKVHSEQTKEGSKLV